MEPETLLFRKRIAAPKYLHIILNGSIFAVAIGLLHIRNHAANQKQRCFRDQEETIRSDIVLDIPQEQSNKTVLHLKKSFLVTAKCRNRDSRNRIQMPERKWRQTVFSAIRFTEKETLFCSLYSFGVTGNEHIHKAKRQTPHESMLPSWCDSQERLIDRKRIDTSKTVSQIVIACQTIKEPVLTGVINVWPVI